MIKITFVIPYVDIKDKIDSLIGAVNEDNIIFETEHIIGAKEAMKYELHSDIVIARGLTYLALKKHQKNSSYVEIEINGYDVIRAIDECKRQFNAKKIAVIGSESMVFGAESLESILDINIIPLEIDNEDEAINALKIAKNQNADAVVSGTMTYNLAKSLGWNCEWVKTGKEAIKTAINEAINSAKIIQTERAKAELLRKVLENANEAIIATDRKGYITTLNKQAYRILNISPDKKIIGMQIRSLFSKIDIDTLIKNGQEEFGIIDKLNDTMIVSNRVPIVVQENTVGVLITFQNVDKIQEIETKIRKELSNKGLTAKYSFGNIVGKSEVLNKTIQTAYKYSQVDSNILIVGETGTGKELFAQSIHNASNRNLQPFVAVNCAALPENLLESELFGYAEGAFSGAVKGGKPGLFELAHKGTIFLDEVGEISINLQAKLLRVLQEKEIRRIGGDKLIPIDVRVISATNIDIERMIEKKKFRQDLLYRLDVLNLKLPSLRERKEDIKDLVEYFMKKYSDKFNKIIPAFSIDALKLISNYRWPGNIRHLRNICERLAVLTEKDYISIKDVERQVNSTFKDIEEKEVIEENDALKEKEAVKINLNKKPLCSSIEEIEMETINKVLESVKYNKAEAAKILGISRTTLWRRLNRSK